MKARTIEKHEEEPAKLGLSNAIDFLSMKKIEKTPEYKTYS